MLSYQACYPITYQSYAVLYGYIGSAVACAVLVGYVDIDT